jgi:hypothetical protein
MENAGKRKQTVPINPNAIKKNKSWYLKLENLFDKYKK